MIGSVTTTERRRPTQEQVKAVGQSHLLPGVQAIRNLHFPVMGCGGRRKHQEKEGKAFVHLVMTPR